MKARHVNLLRHDRPLAALYLAIATANVATAAAIASGGDRSPLFVAAFLVACCGAGICATLGIGCAVRAAFGLDVPEAEGPEE